MIKVIKNQLKLLFFQKGFAIAFLVVMAVCMLNTGLAAYHAMGEDILYQIKASEVFILNRDSNLNTYFFALYIFILLFPFAFQYSKDRQLKITSLVQIRATSRQYYISNAICCFIGTFIVFFVPLILHILLNQIIFPSNGIMASGVAKFDAAYVAQLVGGGFVKEPIHAGIPFLKLYLMHPQLYNVAFALFFSAFCGILAVFIQSLSLWIKTYNVILLVPLLALTQIQKRLETYSEYALDINMCFQMNEYFKVFGEFGQSLVYLVGLLFVIITTSCLMILMKIRQDQF